MVKGRVNWYSTDIGNGLKITSVEVDPTKTGGSVMSEPKTHSLESEANKVIDIVSSRVSDHGNISDRPVEYLGAGLILKAERVKKISVNIISQCRVAPNRGFLSGSDIDGLRDMVAYCLETLRRDSELSDKALPF